MDGTQLSLIFGFEVPRTLKFKCYTFMTSIHGLVIADVSFLAVFSNPSSPAFEGGLSSAWPSTLNNEPHPSTNDHQYSPCIAQHLPCFIQSGKRRAASRFDQHAVVVGKALAGAERLGVADQSAAHRVA